MVFSSKVPSFLQFKVINTSNYFVNKGPMCVNKRIILEQKYNKQKPHVNHFCVFGCLIYIHVPKQNCDKMSSKIKKSLFMGHVDKFKVYRLNYLKQKQIILNNDVTFYENKIGYKHLDGNVLILEKNYFPYDRLFGSFLDERCQSC